jgi:hypothetical protein
MPKEIRFERHQSLDLFIRPVKVLEIPRDVLKNPEPHRWPSGSGGTPVDAVRERITLIQ